MNELQSPDTFSPARPRRRRWLLGVALGVLFLVGIVGIYGYLYLRESWRLQAAIAEADRLDPGWRFEELEAARAVVSEEENAALLVRAAYARLPAGGPGALPGGNPPNLEDRLAVLPLPHRPPDADVQALCTELAAAAAAVTEARGLADRPRGRYTIAWSKDLIGTLIPHAEDAREVTWLLAHDALRRALGGDGAGAVRSCQAAVNAGRSFGDEPVPVSQLVRASCVRRALLALEQVLAHTEPPAESLAALQQLLHEEAEVPLPLLVARAERVLYYHSLRALQTGEVTRATYGMRSTLLGRTGDILVDQGRARVCEAAYLRYFTAVVEVAKRPTEQQQELLATLSPPTERLPPLLDALARGSDWPRLAANFHKTQAAVRCAAVAVALERYRQAEGRWPPHLDALVPRYLSAVPRDPFDGAPLRLRRLDNGLVVYAVGPDRVDNDGTLAEQPGPPGTDVGFRLWNAAHRRQPPRTAQPQEQP